MKFLTPFLIIALFAIFGFQESHAQVDMSGFNSIFESAASNTELPGGVGGTTTGDQSQTDDRDGGGSIDMINANWPVSGKMVIRATKLTWDKGIQPTKITLMHRNDIVFVLPVSGNFINVDFTTMSLDASKRYNLQLSNDEISSKRTSITFVPQTELEEAMKNLENDVAYKEADGVKQKLMKAFFLEQSELNYEAHEAYRIPTSDPNEMKIILTLFNAFRSRT